MTTTNGDRPLNGWELFEEYLIDKDLLNEEFNSAAVAEHFKVSCHEASMLIQSYTKAQRRRNAQTLYVLSRRGRTSSAMWHVGQRTKDVRKLTRSYLSDIACKVTRAMEPDLAHMMTLNPRCARVATAYGNAFIANIELLEAQMDE